MQGLEDIVQEQFFVTEGIFFGQNEIFLPVTRE